MNMEEKEFLRNESVYVRRSTAGNPNTSGAVLAELAKDSDWSVRRSAAGNPNYPNIEPFYTCGCFCGSRKALISRFYSMDCCIDPSIRMRILSSLDEKFKEVFGR